MQWGSLFFLAVLAHIDDIETEYDAAGMDWLSRSHLDVLQWAIPRGLVYPMSGERKNGGSRFSPAVQEQWLAGLELVVRWAEDEVRSKVLVGRMDTLFHFKKTMAYLLAPSVRSALRNRYLVLVGTEHKVNEYLASSMTGPGGRWNNSDVRLSLERYRFQSKFGGTPLHLNATYSVWASWATQQRRQNDLLKIGSPWIRDADQYDAWVEALFDPAEGGGRLSPLSHMSAAILRFPGSSSDPVKVFLYDTLPAHLATMSQMRRDLRDFGSQVAVYVPDPLVDHQADEESCGGFTAGFLRAFWRDHRAVVATAQDAPGAEGTYTLPLEMASFAQGRAKRNLIRRAHGQPEYYKAGEHLANVARGEETPVVEEDGWYTVRTGPRRLYLERDRASEHRRPDKGQSFTAQNFLKRMVLEEYRKASAVRRDNHCCACWRTEGYDTKIVPLPGAERLFDQERRIQDTSFDLACQTNCFAEHGKNHLYSLALRGPDCVSLLPVLAPAPDQTKLPQRPALRQSTRDPTPSYARPRESRRVRFADEASTAHRPGTRAGEVDHAGRYSRHERN